MPHPLSTRLIATAALAALSACGQEPAADPSPQTVIVEAPAENASAAAPAPAAPAPDPAATAAAGPALPPQPADERVRAEITPMLSACLETGDAARGVSVAMGTCFNQELGRQDARLNAAYQAAMARLGTTGKTWLRAEERKWIAERDADCQAQRTGGTIDMVEVPSCLVDETIRRRLQLEAMAG